MFWATAYPSSGETAAYVTLGACYSVWMTGCTPDSHPHRLINVLRINCAPSWLYLQELQECLHCTTYHCIK